MYDSFGKVEYNQETFVYLQCSDINDVKLRLHVQRLLRIYRKIDYLDNQYNLCFRLLCFILNECFKMTIFVQD